MVNYVYIFIYIYLGILSILLMSYKYFLNLDIDDTNMNGYNDTKDLNRMLFHEEQLNNNKREWVIKINLCNNLKLIRREINELFERIVTKFKTFTRRAAYSKVQETEIEESNIEVELEDNRAYFNYDNNYNYNYNYNPNNYNYNNFGTNNFIPNNNVNLNNIPELIQKKNMRNSLDLTSTINTEDLNVSLKESITRINSDSSEDDVFSSVITDNFSPVIEGSTINNDDIKLHQQS